MCYALAQITTYMPHEVEKRNVNVNAPRVTPRAAVRCRRGEECEWPIRIPATVVPYESAVKIRDALSFPLGGVAHASVSVAFNTQQVIRAEL